MYRSLQVFERTLLQENIAKVVKLVQDVLAAVREMDKNDFCKHSELENKKYSCGERRTLVASFDSS